VSRSAPPDRAAYDAWHAQLGVDSAADAPWHRLARSHLPPLARKRVLEIGCGRGGFSAWLATQGPALVVGGDFSAAAVEKARAHARTLALENLKFEVADIQRLTHPDGSFDVVVSCETVEHVPDPRLAVRELARVLAPGGTLVLTTPNYLGLMGLYRVYRRLTLRPYTELGQPINHVVLLPRTIRWVRSAGLRVVEVDGIGHYLPIPGRPPSRLEALDRPRALMKWLALHTIVVATKPAWRRRVTRAGA
jgi:2-polyprenyl-6-hydroxyphenyl methylase/3-demethylubiquinone-9 3-methyltransferase